MGEVCPLHSWKAEDAYGHCFPAVSEPHYSGTMANDGVIVRQKRHFL